jgi:beta-phosphoglucomutase-like phosphatase (HAD superfamily)
MQAIFFGSIGTLVETSEIQRKAFNTDFKEFGLNWYWNIGNYINMIQKPGGILRIKEYSKLKLKDNEVEKIYDLKIKYFRKYSTNSVKPREGVLDVINYANKNNIKLGFITTTTKETIEIIKGSLSRYIDFNNFDLITYEKDCSKKKPNPDIYNFAINNLDVAKNNSITIEDTPVSYTSSKKANIKTILFPGEYSVDKNNISSSYKIFEEVKNFFEIKQI